MNRFHFSVLAAFVDGTRLHLWMALVWVSLESLCECLLANRREHRNVIFNMTYRTDIDLIRTQNIIYIWKYNITPKVKR